MAKRDTELMRIDKRLADEIKKKQRDIEEKINVKITLPQASKSLFEDFQNYKMQRKREIKF